MAGRIDGWTDDGADRRMDVWTDKLADEYELLERIKYPHSGCERLSVHKAMEIQTFTR